MQSVLRQSVASLVMLVPLAGLTLSRKLVLPRPFRRLELYLALLLRSAGAVLHWWIPWPRPQQIRLLLVPACRPLRSVGASALTPQIPLPS